MFLDGFIRYCYYKSKYVAVEAFPLFTCKSKYLKKTSDFQNTCLHFIKEKVKYFQGESVIINISISAISKM